MTSPLRDPKSLPEWIELDYYRRPRRLRRLRTILCWVALFLCPLALAWSFWSGKKTIYQSRPVSTAHTMFNNDCAVCHTGSFETAQRLVPGQEAIYAVPDAACIRCHNGDIHHTTQTSMPNCASCHKEHRGQTHLGRVADGHCIACHAHLERNDGQPSVYHDLSSFPEHPDFTMWRKPDPKDPWKLHFNHQLHLRAEGVLDGNRQLKHLDCAACHMPDEQRHFMKPIHYEDHCASCHALPVQLPLETKDEALLAAARKFGAEPAPHRAPDEVRAALRNRLSQFLEQHPTALDANPGARDPRLLLLPQPPPAGPDTDRRWNWLTDRLQQNERALFDGAGGCAYCHIQKEGSARWTRPDRLPDYLTTHEPGKRWLRSSPFNHESHRMVQCAECHNAAGSSKTGDLLMPHIDSCQRCHNEQVGARNQCVDCHRYHDRSRQEEWKGTLTISDCLAPSKAGK